MFEYQATCINVVDGDTLDVTISLGFRMTTTQRVRLYGVNTPERGHPGAAEATAMLRELVIGRPLIARTVKPVDKYGRFLAQLRTDQCPDVAEALIAAGLGMGYYGGAKPPDPQGAT